jgi:homoserine/homoserine lactone efflux protein
MTLGTWLAFFAASWLISLSPGPGAVSTMASAARYGMRRSYYNLLGLEIGLMFVLVVVATGLGAIIVASATVFTTIKWLGVAYLLFLGIQQLRARGSALATHTDGDAAPRTARGLVIQGFLVNASNPKGIVFMLAVLPQFIDPDQPQVLQYAICGGTLLFCDIVVMTGYALFSSRVLRMLRTPRKSIWLGRIFGGMYAGAAGVLAAFGRHA